MLREMMPSYLMNAMEGSEAYLEGRVRLHMAWNAIAGLVAIHRQLVGDKRNNGSLHNSVDELTC
jgi:hypothetical protein